MREFSVVVAADERWGIGRDGDLAWRLEGDMAWFRRLTVGERTDGLLNTVIMGRRTWESIPDRFRPLPGRHNIVLSSRPDLELPEGASCASSLESALGASPQGDVFVIGGGEVYREALALAGCVTVHLTRVRGDHGCDTFIPDPTVDFLQVAVTPEMVEGDITWDIATLVRPQG